MGCQLLTTLLWEQSKKEQAYYGIWVQKKAGLEQF